MGYYRMTSEQLHAIYERIRAKDSRRKIARDLDLDKKTVRLYTARIEELNLPEGLPYKEILERLSGIVGKNRKPNPAGACLAPYQEEIRSLILGDKEAFRDPMKAKTAWEVVSRRYQLNGKTSYETYKRFVRDHGLAAGKLEAVARIETEPGEEAQIDYGKVGTREVAPARAGASKKNRRRTVYAYCGKLAFCRLPYVQFCCAQDEVSFAQTTASMFEFYGAVPKRLNLDNLKAGVLKAAYYDPKINKTFAELCAHYDVIADPARTYSPKQKGKVERMVPSARELYKRLTALYPAADLEELNEHALRWCLEEYGGRKHGTTGTAPREAFEIVEKACMKPLPTEPYVAASWSTHKVHVDQFIASKGLYFGLPATHIGKMVELRREPKMATIFCNHQKIREYSIFDGRRRHYLKEDFPAYAEPFKPGSYTMFLISGATDVSPQAGKYLRSILEAGGNLAIRRAQGCLTLIKENATLSGLSHVLGQAMAEQVSYPPRLRVLFEAEKSQNILAFPLPSSVRGRAMAREASYYSGT
jgi:transposase